jgi:hypothetical protein
VAAILSFFKHASIKLDPTQFAVNVKIRAMQI